MVAAGKNTCIVLVWPFTKCYIIMIKSQETFILESTVFRDFNRPPRKQPKMTWICQIWVYDLYYVKFDFQHYRHLIFVPLGPIHRETYYFGWHFSAWYPPGSGTPGQPGRQREYSFGFSRKQSTLSACLASLDYLSLVDTKLKNAIQNLDFLHDLASSGPKQSAYHIGNKILHIIG